MNTHMWYLQIFPIGKRKQNKIPCTWLDYKRKGKKLHRKWKSGKSSKALYRWDKPTGRFLVHNLWITVIILQVSKDVIGASAAEVAEAGLNPQHLPGESRPVGTLKLHVNGFGFVGDAAAFVGADAAVFGPVRFLAGAAGDGEVCWLIFPVDIKTFLPWLREQRNRKIFNIKAFQFDQLLCVFVRLLPWCVWWYRPRTAAGYRDETL